MPEPGRQGPGNQEPASANDSRPDHSAGAGRLAGANRLAGPGRRELLLLGAVLALAALLRCSYLLELMGDPDFAQPHFESQYHDYWARALISGDWTPPPGVTDPEIRTTPYFRPPGYPYFLAAVYTVLGPSYLAPRLLQMLLGLASCWLLWSLARRVSGPVGALWAAAIYSVYWVTLFFEGQLMAPSLLIFLLLLLLRTAASWAVVPSEASAGGLTIGSAAWAGLLTGLAALVRPNALLLPLPLLVWALWLQRQTGRTPGVGRRSLWWPCLAYCAALILTVLPATLRNFAVSGEPVLITSNAGINLFLGSHPQSDGLNPGIPAMRELTQTEGWESFDYPLVVRGVQELTGQEMGHREVSQYFTRRLLREAAADPGYLPALLWRKVLLLIGPAEITNNEVLEITREHSRVLSLSPRFAPLLTLALLGVALSLWARPGRQDPAGRVEESRAREAGRRVAWLLVAVGVLWLASYLPFFAAARFRVPMVPLLALFAGHALAEVGTWLSERRWRNLLVTLAAATALYVLLATAWIPYTPDRALWHFRRALSFQQGGDLAAAERELQATLQQAPNYPKGQLLMADLMLAQGQPDAAEAAYLAALQQPADRGLARNNLATLRVRRGDYRGAIEQWEAALQEGGPRPSLLHNLATALATAPDPSLRQPTRAVDLARQLCELGGRQAPALRLLATALRAAGQEQEAEEVEAELLAMEALAPVKSRGVKVP